ncbi:MAG: type II toxin-antitoxin system Phd/YefM family antitoxin [Candidatus Dormibacteria bacterium]
MASGRARVGVREIRQNLSIYLVRVRAGESLEITEHGRPVAILTPTAERSSALQRLISDGRVRPPRHRWRSIPPPLKLTWPKGAPSMSAILDEQRKDLI